MTDTVRLCKNRLHPLEFGICFACKKATQLRGELRRKARKVVTPQWLRREAKRAAEPAKAKRKLRTDSVDPQKVERILVIGDKLQRNPMPWERDKLLAELEQLKRGA